MPSTLPRISSIDECDNAGDSPIYRTHSSVGINTKRQHHDLYSAISLSQVETFRLLARVSLFLCVLIGCLIVLWEPSPDAPSGWEGTVTAKRIGRTWTENVVIAVRDAWPAGIPGVATFLLMCAGVVGALRVIVWAVASAVTGVDLGQRNETKGVRVGRWEDGQSVSGGEILAGMFAI